MMLDMDTFADSLGRDSFVPGTQDYRRAAYALDGAEGKVLSTCNHDDDWTDVVQLPRVVITTIYELAGRKFNNPKGLLSRGVGPLSEGMSPEAAAGLALSDAELNDLLPYIKSRSKLQSVEIKRPDAIANDTLYFTDGYPGSVMRVPFVDGSEADFYP